VSQADVVVRVREAVERALHEALGAPRAPGRRGWGGLVLAVSGGRDSMVMLDAVAAWHPEWVACVATFDHGTGPTARAAVELVARVGRSWGLPVRCGRAAGVEPREASWRSARWAFLREVVRQLDGEGVVATAHTRDDQVETVLMRVLRGAGARGLAGLYAGGEVVRPLLEVSRHEVGAYAAARRLRWVEDPSNASRAYLRNRVRLDLLPALERARPGFSDELLELSRRAAALRAEVDSFLDRTVAATIRHAGEGWGSEIGSPAAVEPVATVGSELGMARSVPPLGHELVVDRRSLAGYDPDGLRLLWPALVARLGVPLDRRGTERLVQFSIKGRSGGRIQLSGGYEAARHRDAILVRRAPDPRGRGGDRGGGRSAETRVLRDGLSIHGWRFHRLGDERLGKLDGRLAVGPLGLWAAVLPADCRLLVRSWQPGDRMTPVGAPAPRRVKGLLRDAGVDAASRRCWPVVLAGEEIVWVPGVRRSSAATVRSGRPVVLYHCERDHR
jgi:tRNA(Ile)-lysidine synthase